MFSRRARKQKRAIAHEPARGRPPERPGSPESHPRLQWIPEAAPAGQPFNPANFPKLVFQVSGSESYCFPRAQLLGYRCTKDAIVFQFASHDVTVRVRLQDNEREMRRELAALLEAVLEGTLSRLAPGHLTSGTDHPPRATQAVLRIEPSELKPQFTWAS